MDDKIIINDDGEITEHLTAKLARGFLRKQGLSVNDFFKLGNIWAKSEAVARETAESVGANPDLITVKALPRSERGPSQKAVKEQKRAEAPIPVHSETYKDHKIVIVKRGAFYHAAYMTPKGENFSAGDYGNIEGRSGKEWALTSTKSTIDYFLSGGFDKPLFA
jgi:hypothetical protein